MLRSFIKSKHYAAHKLIESLQWYIFFSFLTQNFNESAANLLTAAFGFHFQEAAYICKKERWLLRSFKLH